MCNCQQNAGSCAMVVLRLSRKQQSNVFENSVRFGMGVGEDSVRFCIGVLENFVRFGMGIGEDSVRFNIGVGEFCSVHDERILRIWFGMGVGEDWW